jgi:hypothetical protein
VEFSILFLRDLKTKQELEVEFRTYAVELKNQYA